ncbi:hypothetical protein F5050DRAFT_1709430 [Lentinula boryana]|uniref:Uncharacterized protein n=1 Tax=Lentinula boryana TaxID=40481 RepID=A0ABQ8QMX6_9AGAR|nr:hypothetical protein F5050DRAFT_1709430 [Lentinula boryana]
MHSLSTVCPADVEQPIDALSSYSESLSSLSSLNLGQTSNLPAIRAPPPLLLSEIPLRERRGFFEFIIIVPRVDIPGKKAARGQLEPKAGGLPRRRQIQKRAAHTSDSVDSSDSDEE